MSTLSRMLPFSRDVFLRVFEQYNVAIWPVQLLTCGLGVLLVLLVLKPRRGGDRIVAAVLAGFSLWTGVVHHIMFFTTINLADWAFGAVFVLQGVLLLWSGALRGGLRFRFVPGLHGWTGMVFIVFALAAYPLAGWLTRPELAGIAIAGVAPGPTVLFTLGVLLLAETRVPLHLMLIPVFWAFIGGAAAWPLGLPEGLVLPPAAVLGLALAIRKNRRAARRFEGNRGKA